MNENSLIKDIGRSYIVSSFLPAALFVSLGILTYRGFLPYIITKRIVDQDKYFGGQLFILVTFIVWVAFYLFSSGHWTVKFFEGYYLPGILRRPMERRIWKWYKKKVKRIEWFKSVLQDRSLPNWAKVVADTRPVARADYAELELRSPILDGSLLPTRLGLVLRSSEIYPLKRYNIDGLALWPRLIHVLPSEFTSQMEEKNNHMMFLLNSSLLCYINGLIGFLAVLVRSSCQIFPQSNVCQILLTGNNFFVQGFNQVTPLKYLTLVVVWLLGGYLLYRVGVSAAETLALFVRAGFDLYRFDLLRSLHHQMPGTIGEEKTIWERVSEYLIAGDELGSQQFQFEYFASKEQIDDYAKISQFPSRKSSQLSE